MATFTVTNLNDSGAGSLRDCITSTNGSSGNVIDATGVSGTILLASSLPAITKNCTINGPGAAQLTIDGGGGLYTTINITSSAVVTINNLTSTRALGPGFQSLSVSSRLDLNGCCALNNQSYGLNVALTTCTNCTFSGNSSGGVTVTTTGCLFVNCTIVNNTGNGGISAQPATTTTVTNCIVFGNSPSGLNLTFSPTYTVTFSCVQGGFAGTGNISTDPLLQTFVNKIYPLSVYSPCNGTGTHTGAPATDQRGVTRANPPSMGSWDYGVFTTPPGYSTKWLTAIALVGNVIQLSWSGYWLSLTGWDIFRSTSTGTETLFVSSTVTTNNGIQAVIYLDSGLVNGTQYFYKVAPHGTTTYSNEASATAVANNTFSELARLPDPYISATTKVDPATGKPSISINSPVSITAKKPFESFNSPATDGRRNRYGLFGPGE